MSTDRRSITALRSVARDDVRASTGGARSADPDPEQHARDALALGDRHRALEVLMAAYGDRIYRYCCRMTLDSDLAADLLQTTFMQAFEDCQRFHDRSSLCTWLFGIARHRCLDALKARDRRQRRFDDLEMVREPTDPAASLEETALVDERRRALQACLMKLASRARDAVLLRYNQGLSYAEMASICHELAPTLQVRVARAMPVLRRCMELRGMRP